MPGALHQCVSAHTEPRPEALRPSALTLSVLSELATPLIWASHGALRRAAAALHVGGVTANPTGKWTVQQARNLAHCLDERFEDIRFLIRDRGPNFTGSFDAGFQATGATTLRRAVQAPRMNAICERLVGTLRRELLDRVLILGERHLGVVLTEYQAHYNAAWPHQGKVGGASARPSTIACIRYTASWP